MDRRYLYWCFKNGKREGTDFILDNIADITGHQDVVTTGVSSPQVPIILPLQPDSIQYVYNSKASTDQITALFCDQTYYYVVDNTRKILPGSEGSEGSENVQSRLWYGVSITELMDHVPSAVLKHLELKTVGKIKLRPQNEKDLTKVLAIDFVRVSEADQVPLWRKFLEDRQDSETLDLSGLTFLQSRTIVEAAGAVGGAVGGAVRHPALDSFRTLIINQNMGLTSINWIYFFSNLNTLTIWNSDLSDNVFNTLAKCGRGLVTLEFHSCPNISGRILQHLAQMPLLENVVIDNTAAIFHPEKSLLSSCLTDEEWAGIPDNRSIRQLVINSANLTRDYIKPLLARLKGLEHFILHDEVMKQLEKNSANGHENRKIVFHSQDDLKRGFTRYADIKVYGLVRDRCGPMFSQSMLEKIKVLDPTKAEAVDKLRGSLTPP